MARIAARAKYRRTGRALAVAGFAGVMAAGPALSQELPAAEPQLVAELARYETVPDEQLAKMRGGFVVPNGLLNFAIDVAAQINGLRIYEGRLTFSPATGITGGVTHFDTSGFGVPVTGNVKLTDAINQIVTSVQAGNGNIAPVGFNGANGFMMTVQNTLSNVVIQQQMQVQLDLEADRFIPSQAVMNLQSRMSQLRHLTAGATVR
jgi:hypothetical protein